LPCFPINRRSARPATVTALLWDLKTWKFTTPVSGYTIFLTGIVSPRTAHALAALAKFPFQWLGDLIGVIISVVAETILVAVVMLTCVRRYSLGGFL
jgi:hypothetical protein